MTTAELEKFQQRIQKRIYNVAKNNDLLDCGYEPLYDGLCDASAYNNSNLKILWVLKEAYCKGNDTGGWSLTEILFNEYPYVTEIKNQTHQKMAYVSYGILNKCRYEDIDYLNDNPSVGEVLHEIAYININKMPANTSTNDNTLWEKYDIWKNVLHQQIEAYNPDVIIFGNTFKYFRSDLFDGNEPDCDYDYTNDIETDARANVYYYNGRLLIDTNHPQYTGCQGAWANAIIQACQDYCDYDCDDEDDDCDCDCDCDDDDDDDCDYDCDDEDDDCDCNCDWEEVHHLPVNGCFFDTD